MLSCLDYILGRNAAGKDKYFVENQCCICDFNTLVMRTYGLNLKTLTLMSIHENISSGLRNHKRIIKSILNFEIPEMLKAQILMEYVCCAEHTRKFEFNRSVNYLYRFSELYTHIENLFIRPLPTAEPRYFSLTVLTYFYLKYLAVTKGHEFIIKLAVENLEHFPTLHFLHEQKVTLDKINVTTPICFQGNILHGPYRSYKLLSYAPFHRPRVYSDCHWEQL